MKHATIARNYAQALFAAGEAKGEVERFGDLMDAVAGAVQADSRIAIVLDSPRVAKTVKAELLARALGGAAPAEFVRFLQAVVRRGRQGLLGEISQSYQELVDRRLNRVHAGVVVAREADERLQQQMTERLTQALRKEVRAHFRTDPGILGGVVVRVGDRVYDGSVRRRLAVLKRRMLTGE
ncbi:MAG: ATP synthase F1 subunit delta [Gemmatimonadetes bacterium 13_1_40CM_2_70_7]|nr:MAG: ATP synthase F1 subunit delta [Gemmatimonadetes bacterium 13_1_40CM_2_70_7]OLE61620.1 MAG: ATP synthase F1 subunit delta [Gemmatimonadetes bacterium 13_1_20CM_2_70_10]